jgi:hypothetical protein
MGSKKGTCTVRKVYYIISETTSKDAKDLWWGLAGAGLFIELPIIIQLPALSKFGAIFVLLLPK